MTKTLKIDEFDVKIALDLVTRHGFEDSIVDKSLIQYGLDNGIISQGDVDNAQVKYQEFLADNNLMLVSGHGVYDEIVDKEKLKLAIDSGYITPDRVLDEHIKYLKLIGNHIGIAAIRAVPKEKNIEWVMEELDK